MEKSTIDSQQTIIRTQKVQDCQTINDLEKLFDELKTVQGDSKEYSAEILKFKLEQLRFLLNSELKFDDVPWNVITRSHGIRAKCMELFYYEKHGS